ncbi:uncharacterized protein LOC127858343 isoform X2 [Dreissena polymorpha]|uniref:uncharacterized protein LOC127858343 isoform X2 n=1 Tax=Dreissena polymorpha TaxID=45954 RepID=UPI002264450B|nr:uncharacterized protein LOC127858343 isoform X2 [Dreissena polymorpha]
MDTQDNTHNTEPDRKFLLKQAQLPPKHSFEATKDRTKTQEQSDQTPTEPRDKLPVQRSMILSDAPEEIDNAANQKPSNEKPVDKSAEDLSISGQQTNTSSFDIPSSYRTLEKRIADLEKETKKLKKKVKYLEEQRANTSVLYAGVDSTQEEDPDKQLYSLLALVAHLSCSTERDANLIIRRLSLQVFSKNELVTCTRTGKKTVKAGETPKPALNSEKMDLLEKAFLFKCPNMITDAFRKKFDNVLKMERRIK